MAPSAEYNKVYVLEGYNRLRRQSNAIKVFNVFVVYNRRERGRKINEVIPGRCLQLLYSKDNKLVSQRYCR